MSRGRREEIVERKLNVKKVILIIGIILLISICVIAFINKDKILKKFKNFEDEKDFSLENKQENEGIKIEDVLAEFGGEIIEHPKTDTYIVLKDGKHYTIYSDGEIIEEKISLWNGQSSKPAIDEVGNYNIYSEEELICLTIKRYLQVESFA